MLDQIWANFNYGYDFGIISVDITDHLPIFIHVKSTYIPNDKIKIQFRPRSNELTNLFVREISNFPWANELNAIVGVDNKTSFLQSKIDEIFAKCFPLKTKFISEKRAQKPWLSNNLMNGIKTKAKLFKLFKVGIVSKEQNTSYARKLNKDIVYARKMYYLRIFNSFKTNSKKYWENLGTLTGKSKTLNRLKKINDSDGLELTNNGEIAEAFNRYFSSIPQILNSEIRNCTDFSPTHFVPHVRNSLFMSPSTEGEISRIISSLKNSSYGIGSPNTILF